MGQLHALGPGSGARRVVERGCGALVGLVPWPRLDVGQVQVVVLAEQELVRDVEGVEDVLERWVGVDDLRAGVLDDVGDLGCRQPEVDRNQDPSPAADAEERVQQTGRVLRDDRHPAARRHAELVELRRLRARPRGEIAIGQLAEAGRRLVGLVDDGDPVGVHAFGAVEEVTDGQRNEHDGLALEEVTPRTGTTCAGATGCS